MHIAELVSIVLRRAWLAASVIATVVPAAVAQTPTANATVQSAPDGNVSPDSAPAPGGAQPVDPSIRATLADFGTFQTIATLGEVWKPTIVPADWRPYAACHWVNSRKYGWYYDDRTAWGAIIHHYGRWTHVVSLGWVWVPGADFSPGWVAWRTSPSYVGWAPLPPNGDLKGAEAAAFDNGGFWTFMETPVFDKGCGGADLPNGREAALLTQTQPVTATTFVGGILIAVLPDYVVGPLVEIDISVKPWPSKDLLSILAKWNVAWNSIDVQTIVNVIDCEKPRMPPPPRIMPPRADPCLSGSYLQPDGRCAVPVNVRFPLPLPVPPQPPVCADGGRPDSRGQCGSQQAYNPLPPSPIRTPPVFIPPVIVPPGVTMPGPLPPPIVMVVGCHKPGFEREPDGRCRRRPVVVNPPAGPPPVAVVPIAPPLVIAVDACRRPGFVRQSSGLCRRPGAPVVAVAPFVPPSVAKATRPAFVPQRPTPVGARPIRIRPSRPAVTRPAFVRPKFVRPASTVRRPAIRRPVRPRPAVHAAFRPARPVFHPRPVFHSAPHPSAPRGGGRRHR